MNFLPGTINRKTMENSKLPADVQHKIEKDAELFADKEFPDYHKQPRMYDVCESSYEAGATEWAEKWWEEKRAKEGTALILQFRMQELAQLREENERLRAALEEITKQDNYYDVIEIASKALASVGKEGEDG